MKVTRLSLAEPNESTRAVSKSFKTNEPHEHLLWTCIRSSYCTVDEVRSLRFWVIFKYPVCRRNLLDRDWDTRQMNMHHCAAALVEKKKWKGGEIEKSGTKKNRESGIRESWMSAIALMPLFTEKCYSSSLRQTGRCSSAFTTCVYLHRNSKLMLMLTVHARVLKKKNTSMCMYSSAN